MSVPNPFETHNEAHLMAISNHKHHLGKAIRTTMLSVLALIEYPGEPFLLRHGLEIAPSLARLQKVYSSAPLVVLYELRGRGSIVAA